MAILFGTDGVRGVANAGLTPEIAFSLGRAGAYVLSRDIKRPQIVIGKDTRVSGDMLEAALMAGICSVGADVYRVGILPTPGVAYLTRNLGAAAGVVISASHNPVQDNGLKFFAGNGFKLPDALEAEIEALATTEPDQLPRPLGMEVGRVYEVDKAQVRYARFLQGAVPVDLTGLTVVVDAANGAAYEVAPQVLSSLGARVIPINCKPNGVNINAGCGSTYPGALQEAVLENRADLGLAHDGDADRVIMVDEKGNLVDGDAILVICGLNLAQKKALPMDTVVVTVMSNLGLHLAFQKEGVKTRETKVGDRYVLEEMLQCGAKLGGEQSGHIIFLEHNTTGDGILTGLQLMAVMQETKCSLSNLAAQMTRLPQVLLNVRVKDKQGLDTCVPVQEKISWAEEKLGKTGRILVRPSGTEQLIRVMAEGPAEDELKQLAGTIARTIERHLG